MKKILLSTVILSAFAFSIILFQISCKKESKADSTTTTNTVTQQGLILYGQQDATNGDKTNLWIANYDGSNAKKINITLPTDDLVIDQDNGLSISPDHKTIFFAVYSKTVNATDNIYSCSIDGSNVKKVLTATDSIIAY